jgi:hypothetical protein
MADTTSSSSISATKVMDDSSSQTRATSIMLDIDGDYIVSGILLDKNSKSRKFGLVKLQSSSLKTSWRKTIDLQLGG